MFLVSIPTNKGLVQRYESYPKGPCEELRLRKPFVWQSDLWRKLKVEFANVIFVSQRFAKVVRYDWNIHEILKMKLYFSIYVVRFFAKVWRKF